MQAHRRGVPHVPRGHQTAVEGTERISGLNPGRAFLCEHMGVLTRPAVSILDRYSKCGSGASRNPNWDSTVIFKHMCAAQRAHSAGVSLTIVPPVPSSATSDLSTREINLQVLRVSPAAFE